MKDSSNKLNLPGFSVSVKALFTGYIMVVGLGLMMAGLQVMLTHGMADGKFGISVDDIVYSYYGNRSGSKLESKLNGSMADKASAEEKFIIIDWVKEGSADKEVWQETIKPIIDKNCIMCHAHMHGMELGEYEQLAAYAEVDEGASLSNLAKVSHIHLFGISFIFFFVGLIFVFAVGFNKWIKATIIIVPFVFLIVDIAAWWLTKINPGFAWFVIVGGVGYSLAAAIMLFTSLYQMWIMPLRNKESNENVFIDIPKN